MTDFTFDFTEEKLTLCVPTNKNIPALFAALNNVLPRYDISSVERVAAFLAQCGHESLNFTVLRENLNYSVDGLQRVFKRFFPTPELAQQYAKQPEKIANRVYANRMGNGDEASGDGYKYRGRGAIQLTGHDNYQAFAMSISQTIDEAVTYCETYDGAIESACWYWKKNNLNTLADALDVLAMTKRINGGTIGLQERQEKFDHNLQVLQ